MNISIILILYLSFLRIIICRRYLVRQPFKEQLIQHPQSPWNNNVFNSAPKHLINEWFKNNFQSTNRIYPITTTPSTTNFRQTFTSRTKYQKGMSTKNHNLMNPNQWSINYNYNTKQLASGCGGAELRKNFGSITYDSSRMNPVCNWVIQCAVNYLTGKPKKLNIFIQDLFITNCNSFNNVKVKDFFNPFNVQSYCQSNTNINFDSGTAIVKIQTSFSNSNFLRLQYNCESPVPTFPPFRPVTLPTRVTFPPLTSARLPVGVTFPPIPNGFSTPVTFPPFNTNYPSITFPTIRPTFPPLSFPPFTTAIPVTFPPLNPIRTTTINYGNGVTFPPLYPQPTQPFGAITFPPLNPLPPITFPPFPYYPRKWDYHRNRYNNNMKLQKNFNEPHKFYSTTRTVMATHKKTTTTPPFKDNDNYYDYESELISLTEKDICDILSPCENGGTCISRRDMTYVCQCLYPFTGIVCGQSMFVLWKTKY
ncbi:hypothetical protein SNEBB_010351 [Seison nebaliae]|nr:hypothetical protein SNEBB_010351 [Seison nebaliae]